MYSFLNMLVIQLSLVKRDLQKLTYYSILTLNPVFQKILIFTKEPEAKYNFLLKKFPNDVKICYQNDEYDLDSLI